MSAMIIRKRWLLETAVVALVSSPLFLWAEYRAAYVAHEYGKLLLSIGAWIIVFVLVMLGVDQRRAYVNNRSLRKMN
jgi:uncharacterized membrane protein